MDQAPKERPPASQQLFTCAVCGFSVPYQHIGQTLPEPAHLGGVIARSGAAGSAATQHVFLERVYLICDPNAVQRVPLALGSACSVCGQPVCADDGCSVFYARRFCAACARKNAALFPPQLLQVSC